MAGEVTGWTGQGNEERGIRVVNRHGDMQGFKSLPMKPVSRNRIPLEYYATTYSGTSVQIDSRLQENSPWLGSQNRAQYWV